MSGGGNSVAFTLAEVLITLGIIGVVAAMTMPVLIAKHRAQVLKNQFAKAYSTSAQQLLAAKTEFGIDEFGKYCISYNAGINKFVNKDECISLLDSKVKIIGKCTYKTPPKTYNMGSNAYVDIGATARPRHLLADGTCYEAIINASILGISIDINGPLKGPNALGHDIFSFYITGNDKLTGLQMSGYLNDDDVEKGLNDCAANGNSGSCIATVGQKGFPCSRTSSQKGNGLGCALFAIKNICPDDPSKKYWECLP